MAALLPPVSDAEAGAKARELFKALQAKVGMVPNIWRTMGHAPDVLQTALDLDAAIKHELDPKLRELAYLKTTQLNNCHY
jgi:alkylhydroperoxidase family enzyme